MALLAETPLEQRDWLSRAAGAGLAVLAFDQELARTVDARCRDRAVASSRSRFVNLAEPSSIDDRVLRAAVDGYGLLVLDGILLYEWTVGARQVADLMAAGDLLSAPRSAALRTNVRCRVLRPARLAVLDWRWAARMAPYPSVAGALTGRVVTQSKRVAAALALTNHVHLEVRLWLLLWHLADRFGRVRPDGVRLDVPLGHETLAALARARRPSVSTALGSLASKGLLHRDRDGWLLTAELDDGPKPMPRGRRDEEGAMPSACLGRPRSKGGVLTSG